MKKTPPISLCKEVLSISSLESNQVRALDSNQLFQLLGILIWNLKQLRPLGLKTRVSINVSSKRIATSFSKK